MSLLQNILAYPFLSRALLVGSLVSLCAALLGVSLVLKRYSMIGDGLSHVGFGALSVAMVLNITPLAFALPVVVAAAFFLLRLSENSKLRGDSAIAILSSGALAIGIVVTSLSSGMNMDISGYLFGSILSMNQSDVLLSCGVSAAVLCLFILFYHKIFAVTFDELFAKATGVRTDAYNMLIAFLTAATIAVGMRMMGTLLISSLIIFPAITAMRVCKSFRGVVLTAAAVSLVCFFAGMIASYLLGTPAGASVVLANLAMLGLFALVAAVKKYC